MAFMQKVLGRIWCLAPSVLFAANKINMPEGVTPISHEIYKLHMLIFYICVVVGVLTFGVITYTILKQRKSRGVKPAKFHGNFWVEVV